MDYKKKSLRKLKKNESYEEIDTRLASGWYVDALNGNNKKKYNYIYIISIMLGATSSLSMMINLIDTFFALMAIPTMIATLILAPKVLNELKKYEIKR